MNIKCMKIVWKKEKKIALDIGIKMKDGKGPNEKKCQADEYNKKNPNNFIQILDNMEKKASLQK